ncbi:FAD-dependent oxidoreductase [Pseudoalteromonas neustonica]|uniref:FAD-dependent oxidoreductase n=2 Tax=Pseudoalteromonas TaxID=53246 RepID=A0ABU9TZT6_9GAMM|nr:MULTISPECIES: FAD-dependent oxidoreductase [Pseudoalteromonas]
MMNNQNTVHEVSQQPHEQLKSAQSLMATYWNNTLRLVQALKSLDFKDDQLLTQASPSVSETPGLTGYQAQTLIFNTRLRFNPAVIIMCESTKNVAQAYKQAISLNLPIRVRSGGHDHEGECTGTDVILLDLSRLTDFNVDKVNGDYIASIGSGYRFFQVVPKLADNNPPLTIPHGTCATVGLAGFIQGGGWGPWTRSKGMCCESLVGATVVLGNGDIVEVNEKSHQALLWALRGGGALSYGIVTNFKVKAFEIPEEIHRFVINWNTNDEHAQLLPTFELLSQWEDVINNASTDMLVGTNLKINAVAAEHATSEVRKLCHPSSMYGYWQGSWQALEEFVTNNFSNSTPVHQGTDTKANYNSALMSNWSRNSLYDVLKNKMHVGNLTNTDGMPFTPDFDAPAPHKLTSKVVKISGLKKEGKDQLIQSLTSDLINAKSSDLGLFSYVTLGAIAGPFYDEISEEEPNARVAFPYSKSQYTIQYQTWWNESVELKEKGQNNEVYNYINRAMDWIEVSRETQINGTEGAFISFKDSAIPTKTYFLGSYQQLIDVKEAYSKDSFNHLRSRKTII